MKGKPYKKGYLDVGDNYKIYYECCGNRKGLPILFLHGGPGAGFGEKHKQSADLRKTNLILFDQRGAGRSRPFASIKDNTTAKLVQDINKLLDFLEIKKVVLHGGSWGSTLALVYAIRNPKKVSGLILGGIFLTTDEDNKFYNYTGKYFFPTVYERMISFVPKNRRKNPLKFYAEKMMTGDKKIRKKYAQEWSNYEHALMELIPSKQKHKLTKNDISLGVLETYYLSKGCFIPEGYILKNAKKIKVPVSIIHGQYDMICPPRNAWKLHNAIHGSKLQFVMAGHGFNNETRKAVVAELKRFTTLIKH